MLFNSITFIVFFAVVLLLHSLPLTWTAKKRNLLLASYLFYAAWNPPFVLLLWISTAVDWTAATNIANSEKKSKRRTWLLISMCTNLGLLGFFKYGGFLLDNFVTLLGILGLEYAPAPPDIILPVGISFYTFQSMAYTIDVYLRRQQPTGSMLDFALFVTFFPQLVAGPIVKPSELIPQFKIPRSATPEQLSWGLGLMVLGLFEKIVVADAWLAPVADQVFSMTIGFGMVDTWIGTLAFGGQIFCDFAGYSTIAIGVALCLGFVLPENFNYPYAAVGFSDFWRRWHISLSRWLRDYLYIPLGGNRKGKIRTLINLTITMFLGGLWHGANWTFVIWGLLHGTYLAIERLLKHLFAHQPWTKQMVIKFLMCVLTYYCITIAWVFFRAENIAQAWEMIVVMHTFLSGADSVLTSELIWRTSLITVALFLIHWWMRNTKLKTVADKLPWWQTGLIAAGLLILILTNQRGSNAFIYFQF